MENKICMFCGHRDLFGDCRIKNVVLNIINDLIENKGVTTFYTGEMGDFDKVCSSCVRVLKQKHKEVTLIWIIPYLSKTLVENSEYINLMYDDVIMPECCNCFPKGAIKKRNRWMVDKSDYIISYVYRDFGGAYDTLKYGEKKSVNIIRI